MERQKFDGQIGYTACQIETQTKRQMLVFVLPSKTNYIEHIIGHINTFPFLLRYNLVGGGGIQFIQQMGSIY